MSIRKSIEELEIVKEFVYMWSDEYPTEYVTTMHIENNFYELFKDLEELIERVPVENEDIPNDLYLKRDVGTDQIVKLIKKIGLIYNQIFFFSKEEHNIPIKQIWEKKE